MDYDPGSNNLNIGKTSKDPTIIKTISINLPILENC